MFNVKIFLKICYEKIVKRRGGQRVITNKRLLNPTERGVLLIDYTFKYWAVYQRDMNVILSWLGYRYKSNTKQIWRKLKQITLVVMNVKLR